MASIISAAGKILPEFNSFSKFVLENQKQITPRVFSQEFIRFQRGCDAPLTRDMFCQQADDLALKLIEQKNKDLPGIIYSGLCKMTEAFPNQLERFALSGYKVAKSKRDYVHMMARLNDLRKVYTRRPDKLYDYIQVLYKQEKCLKQLTNHYDESVLAYQSVIRKPASKDDYRQMLAYVQTEIGKLTRKKHPDDALKKLLNAREIFVERGNKQSVSYVDMLISEIKNGTNA